MKLRGLCVGGILDGQYITHDSNMLRIPNKNWTPRLREDGSEAGYQPDKYHTYVFVTRYWWPYEHGKAIPGLTTILEKLEESYHACHKELTYDT
jgi:hypothetical protein